MKYLLITIGSAILAGVVILYERALWMPQTKSLISSIISISVSSFVYPKILNKLFKLHMSIRKSLMLFLFLNIAGFLGLFVFTFYIQFPEKNYALFVISSVIIFTLLISCLLIQRLIDSYQIKKNTILFNITLSASPFLINFLTLVSSLVLVFNILTPAPPFMPFWKSIQSGNINAVRQHIRAGTSANKSEGIGEQPLHWAALENRVEIGKLLIRNGANVNGRGMHSKQPILNRAIMSGNPEFVELLIRNGANVNIKRSVIDPITQKHGFYLYPLDFAISLFDESYYTKNARLKLSKIIDILRKNGSKSAIESSIYIAAECGSIKSIKLHLDRGLKINEKSKNGLTPLHSASIGGKVEIAELLISKGADVNAESKILFTPLHYAAAYARAEVLELLISEGAKVNVKNNYGWLPLTLAMRYNNAETADLLKKHGANSGAKDTIQIAAAVGDIDSVKEHLDAGIDINSKSSAGWTALIESAYSGREKIAKLLIAKGADVNAMTDRGSTALHITSARGHKKIAAVLIEKGADVNARDIDSRGAGDTPLDMAINKRKRHPELADLLRKHGGKTGEELEAEGK
jgi:ankyrin repeat protein